MRVTSLIAAGLVLLLARPAFPQDWTEFTSRQDSFGVNFPGQPRVEEITWVSEYRYSLKGRVYSAARGQERYSVTVVDYRDIEKQAIERVKACPKGAEPCIGGEIRGPGYWKHDVRGAIMYATFKLLQRDAKLTHLMWNTASWVEGNMVQLTNNADQTRTFAWIFMHDNRLYIFEGTVPAGNPEPGLFQQSVDFYDKDGNRLYYQGIVYSNAYHGLGDYPTPPGVRGGAGGAGSAGAGAGAVDSPYGR
jgi:hypothetical protein